MGKEKGGTMNILDFLMANDLISKYTLEFLFGVKRGINEYGVEEQ